MYKVKKTRELSKLIKKIFQKITFSRNSSEFIKNISN